MREASNGVDGLPWCLSVKSMSSCVYQLWGLRYFKDPQEELSVQVSRRQAYFKLGQYMESTLLQVLPSYTARAKEHLPGRCSPFCLAGFFGQVGSTLSKQKMAALVQTRDVLKEAES